MFSVMHFVPKVIKYHFAEKTQQMVVGILNSILNALKSLLSRKSALTLFITSKYQWSTNKFKYQNVTHKKCFLSNGNNFRLHRSNTFDVARLNHWSSRPHLPQKIYFVIRLSAGLSHTACAIGASGIGTIHFTTAGMEYELGVK